MEYNRPMFRPRYVKFVSDSSLGDFRLRESRDAYVGFINSTLASAQKVLEESILKAKVCAADGRLSHFSEAPCLQGPSFDTLYSVLPGTDLWYVYGSSDQIHRFVECGEFLCTTASRFVACTESPYTDGVTSQTIWKWHNQISPGSRLSLKDVEAFFAFLPNLSFFKTNYSLLEIHGMHQRKFLAPIPGSRFRCEVVAFGEAFPPSPKLVPDAKIVSVERLSKWSYGSCFRC
ncbi:hypothetical protein GOZ78_21405 [Agrobacterium vitis]|nr:hypothetical protein [Agrobacterium vitis]MUO81328.1 hypothetical protein [Agrobacterium vitis]MUO98058.1 hypothetical protein [Agrobacterium vitis]MUP06957.1 hypothetical protein [Agrobacterium vitis]MVA12560.1 hypothetical protein [Agrobacterium vitis]